MKRSLLRLGVGVLLWRLMIPVGFLAAQGPAALSLPVPFEESGACPFEGCVYRDWTAKAPVTVRTARRHDAPVAFTVQPAEIITAVTGTVITVKAGRVQFREPRSLSTTAGTIRIAPGQTLYLLTYHGEGLATAWFDGTLYRGVDTTDFVNAVCGSRPERCAGKVVEEARTEWWVQVRNQSGAVGWTIEPEKFDGKSVIDLLARIHADYAAARDSQNVARLVSLDGDLRQVLASDRHVSASHLRPGYAELGLATADFEPSSLVYSGKLLREAHHAAPRSPSRAFTLYSTLFPKGEHVDDVPDVEAARAYLAEFPMGPFAFDVHLHLAHFHDDLYKVLRGLAGGNVPDYKLECYKSYVTREPYQAQQRAALDAGVASYRRALALRPGHQEAQDSLAALVKGSNLDSWYFCAD